MYVLLSGRWYRSKSKEGPWTLVRADELPVAFADIPPASDIGGLRAWAAVTDEANEALRDGLVLPAVFRLVVLPAPADLRLPCRL